VADGLLFRRCPIDAASRLDGITRDPEAIRRDRPALSTRSAGIVPALSECRFEVGRLPSLAASTAALIADAMSRPLVDLPEFFTRADLASCHLSLLALPIRLIDYAIGLFSWLLSNPIFEPNAAEPWPKPGLLLDAASAYKP